MEDKKSTLKTILKYIIPSIFSMWIFTIYTLVDGIFIGRYVGSLGLAGVNITMPLINLTFALGIMIGVGSSTLIAIFFGKNKIENGNKIFTTAVISLISIGLITSLLIHIFATPLINLLGGKGELFSYVYEYLWTISYFCVFYMTGYAVEIYIKIDGNPIYPTFCVITGGVINILLDYVFVALLGGGIGGAALATGISQMCTTGLLFYYIFFRTKKIGFVPIRYSIFTFFNILKLGVAEFLAEISMGIATLTFNLVILAKLGQDGVATFGVITYISSLITMTMIGLNQGVQPLLSFNLGAKKYDKIKEITKISFVIITLLSLVTFVVIRVFSDDIISIFLKDMENIINTRNALRIYSLAFLILGYNIFGSGYFTALKKVYISTAITLMRGIILLMIFIFTLPHIFGNNGIWLTPFFAEICTLVFVAYIFRRERFMI